MKILIVDPKCPMPYDNFSHMGIGIGGTESTVIKIANQLAQKHTVVVSQHNRHENCSPSETLHFSPPNAERQFISSPDVVIFIQLTQDVVNLLALKYPRARKILWIHNYVAEEIGLQIRDIVLYGVEIVCVSETHKNHTLEKINASRIRQFYFRFLHKLKIHYIYNPIADDLTADDTPVDSNKLVFFSSPHKGLENVVRLFSMAKSDKDMQKIRLFIANPGYRKDFDFKTSNIDKVINLGSLPQSDVIYHVRTSLCVFFPQVSRPETFGLIYAEANAVGTPVLAHDFGSAKEVLGDNAQILDCTDDRQVIQTLRSWYLNGKRPQVQANPDFRLKNVVEAWEKLICN